MVSKHLRYNHCAILYTCRLTIPYLNGSTEIQIKDYLTQYRDPLRKSFMDILLETSFMRSGTTSDMKIGHANEPIIMTNAMMLCKPGMQSLTHYKINFAASVGLVQNESHKFMHASPDYLMVVEDEERDKHVMFAEIKCRTRPTTIQRETRLSTGRNKWISVTAGHANFFKYVQRKSERMQLLHQAATLDLNKGLLLIGNNKGQVIRGIWISFSSALLSSYRLCMKDIHKESFAFTSEALIGVEDPDYYINPNNKLEVEKSIRKQCYVDYNSFVYNFRLWVAMRKMPTPLKSSNKVLPKLASLWNRSKNGSDVATGVMRGAWYPLPTSARTPQALVIQRCLFLMQMNIMRITNTISYKCDDTTREDIDKFRNRSNKFFGSYRAFVLHTRKHCILPLIEKEKQRHHICREIALQNVERDTPQTPTRGEDSNSTHQRNLRSTSTHLTITDVSSSLQITGTTPPTRKGSEVAAATRTLQCKMPISVSQLNTSGAKTCERCGQRTVFFCLGCHRYLCQKTGAIPKPNIPETYSCSVRTFNLNLGKRSRRKLTNDKTKSGKHFKRLPVEEDVEVQFNSTCHLIAHRHLFKGISDDSNS